MLVSIKEMLKEAKEGGYCVPAFGIGNEHNMAYCLKAAEEKNSPVIMLFMYGKDDIERFGRIATDMAVKSSVPVSIILDHGATFEHAIWAIRAGFSDIMIDRSSLPYEENVAQVKELVKIAHAVGVGVEAELGHVGFGEVDGNLFTDPAQAAEFVKETGVDALAVSIGTTHGAYKLAPNLQFDLLEELRDTVPVPLVLHGGSGTGDENLRKTCSLGINKLNIAYELNIGAIDVLNSSDLSGFGAYGLYNYIGEGFYNVANHYIDLCGSAGKA